MAVSELELKNLPSITVDETVNMLANAYLKVMKAGLSPSILPSVMLWGPPGVGKSQAIRQNLPRRVKFKEDFEVRGEGVISWENYNKVCPNTQQSHPRNVAAGAVRSFVPDRGLISNIEFFAFELIRENEQITTKEEQLAFLKDNGFTVVENKLLNNSQDIMSFAHLIHSFNAKEFAYPADGIMTEYNDIAYGKSLGATTHHENRMMALKWEDTLYDTTFRRVTLATTRTGKITLAAEFDPVLVEGNYVSRADLHSFEHFKKLKLGVGDKIKVYKANQIIPQIAENLTQSGTYKFEMICPCCASPLEAKNNTKGSADLYCTNEECIARNAQKIVKFCASEAMNINGLSTAIIEKLMSYDLIKSFKDIYRLKRHRERIIAIPGIGITLCDKIISAIDESRYCRLGQFLNAVDIPYMNFNAARTIDEYFYGSFEEFEKALNEHFNFTKIENITEGLNRSIYNWYTDESKEKLWRPLLEELTFVSDVRKVGKDGNPFYKTNVVLTGTVNGMNHDDLAGLMEVLGANVLNGINKSVHYLIVGSSPDFKLISEAMMAQIPIVNEKKFAQMLGNSEV